MAIPGGRARNTAMLRLGRERATAERRTFCGEERTLSIAEQVRVPLLDLKAQYATIRDEVQAALDRVIESQHFILGPEVQALEREVAAYSGCDYGVGMSSGSDALLAALMAIDLKPGDE